MFNKKRFAQLKRKTNEVDINGQFNLDGSGKTEINTGFEPLNHLLTLFVFHGLFDLDLKAKGDLQHHIIEDIGIALGKALKESLGSKQGINRYGTFSVTMDKVVVEANVDISGRPSITKKITDDKDIINNILANDKFDDTNFSYKDAEEFLEAFVQHSGLSLVYIIKSGEGDLHHILEALFKALGKAIDQASQIDPRRRGVPSTKGIID
ncbi:MAG: imidazoleglycerol-phosphate dehydratase [Candidatus Omnitrophica bacterium]|nr:imidazoleglycerol-phosphate dehydratase [Candidatus Omnitrophota bacterium]MCF7887815.1 imidazoleglycerol-phosphate dehydratase [Candidatus Omnitrophota bacterium]